MPKEKLPSKSEDGMLLHIYRTYGNPVSKSILDSLGLGGNVYEKYEKRGFFKKEDNDPNPKITILDPYRKFE